MAQLTDLGFQITYDTSRLNAELEKLKPKLRRYWRRHPIGYIRFRLDMIKHRKTWKRLCKFFSGGDR